MMRAFHSNYGWTEMTPKDFQKKVKRVAKIVEKLKEKHDIDAIAVSGSSGCAMAFPVSFLTGVPVVYVRKPDENSHGTGVESMGFPVMERYVILDDFVCSGTTIDHIKSSIEGRLDAKPVCLVLYDCQDRKRSRLLSDGTRLPIMYAR